VSAPALHWTERLPGGRSPAAAWILWVETTLALLALWLPADALLGRFGAGDEEPTQYWWRRAVVAALTGWIVASSRFAGLAALAIGSWLGGAIVERVLGWLVPG
jgi:hypothetical protein